MRTEAHAPTVVTEAVAAAPAPPMPCGLFIAHCPFCPYRAFAVNDDMGRGEAHALAAVNDHALYRHWYLVEDRCH